MLEYVEINRDDLDELSELYEVYLNSGGRVKGWLQEGLNDSRYCGIKCLDDGKIVGAISARPNVEFTCGHEEIVNEINDRWKGLDLFTADMLTVLPAYRESGVGRELTIKHRDQIIKNGGHGIVVELWHKNNDERPGSGLLKYLGNGELLGVYDDFYKDLDKYGLSCPDCGLPCSCGADVYVIVFE